MLFNSYTFVLFFLPVVLVGFYVLSRGNERDHAITLLVAASLFFYGWWNPHFLALIVGSITVNFLVGRRMSGAASASWMWAGIAFNLGLLGYFKYANFFAEVMAQTVGAQWRLPDIVLPLAISFFTFQQITYLVDMRHGRVAPHRFREYCLFVTFFPQLIAGPIVHHKEMMPQFSDPGHFRFSWENLGFGLSVFFIGLFKKVVIADWLSRFATPVFTAAETGTPIGLIDGWGGALAYTFQLYFDFSGYTDMATGLALMFGIRLPMNFYSPYKAVSIIDFWHRWHMTLSRFLRDYLYIPLGGNRHGRIRRYVNLMATMVLGGLWHGAGWTFIAWGALHGIYLVINNLWRAVTVRTGITNTGGTTGRWAARTLTFLAVVAAWVLFRAESLDGAANVFVGMIGGHGVNPPQVLAEIKWHEVYRIIAFLLAMVWFAPNTAQMFRGHAPVLPTERILDDDTPQRLSVHWRPAKGWAFILAVVAAASLANMTEISEFLYFRF
ncbi:MAG: membrane-bound O-acyltransferase family protein [Rhodospirillales bacterium CG15_BIG_FIL_POST_REV_8_21_14_020_66_15]|nr:MAG: membrane-bound O-acyltransferase family protein [Rhodospirillales bacterium CG15_BIG_FIL_POST_REV_8_21_14_020_66_15]